MVHKGQVNPSEAQRAYRSAGLDFWFPTKGGRQGRPARRRAVVEHFLNGDWLSTVVEHFCPENCCASEHEARESMLRLLPNALLPHSATRMAQHRWTKLRLGSPCPATWD